ncbi:MAG: MFS transporter [Bryobacteraceae bacterium]|nr:MFS transporter [Bryobacteraceae bacterium]
MRYRYGVLALLFCLSIITYVDRVCISVAGPRMQEELNLGPDKWGWVVGAFTISYALFEIPSGAMADKIGARKVLTRIVLWWSAFTSLTGMVSSFPMLLLTRFAFGAGEAGAYPGSASSLSRWFPANLRGRATSAVWMASRLGGALSPLLVVPIQQAYGWRMSFLVFGAVGVVWCAVWWTWYRDRPSLKKGVTEEEIRESEEVRGEVHHGLPWGIALRKRNFWIILAMYHTYCWGSYFYLSWLHTFLQKGRGYTENEILGLSWLPFVAGAIGNVTGGTVSDVLVKRIGLKAARRTVGSVGLLLSAGFMLAAALTPGKVPAIVFLSLGYFSMDCMLPVAWAVCLDVGRKYAGAVSGSMNMAGQIGSFLSSIAFGYLVKFFGDYNLPLIPFSGMLALSAFLFTRINPEQQLIPEDERQTLPRAA